ncbi:MAG: hypothetical protein JWN76_2484 [Chitinophagaceae bacterium]|nr:hypothetical protein [Chitinophagaceae bacterium]
MKRILLCVLVISPSIYVQAQLQKIGRVSAIVVNEQKVPLENATIELIRAKDSSLVKVAFTGKNGDMEFDRLALGIYRLRISMVNYMTTISPIFSITTDQFVLQLLPVTLTSKPANMPGVMVSAKKPFIQKLSDRIVVNIENSIVNAGSSALDVLERSPGVSIDQNDMIALRGKQGVIIMIDGKPSPMTGGDLANFLRGLASSAIERIDIITNPSAKYDAAGNSGIIDIRMKKDQRLGANGNITAGYGQGIYPKANAGSTFNYRNKKVNVFGNYNYVYRMNLNHLILDRNFYNNGVFNGEDNKDNYTKTPLNSHTARLGADFFATTKTVFGFIVTSNFNHLTPSNNNNSLVIDAQKQPSYTFENNSYTNSHSNNVVVNINIKHQFDSTGKELTADADYGVYHSSSLSTNSTKYFKLNGSTQQPDYILKGDQTGKLILRTAKADYVNPLARGAKLEAGIKTSYVSSDNDVKFFDASSGTPQNDETKTNHFLYDEYNNAVYLNFSRQLKRFNYQIGLRGEQTNVKTRQVKGNVLWDSSYFQLFPSVFFNYNLKQDQTVGLSVSRRIDRPGYSQLNPFLFLIDISTYSTGNPSLAPQLTWSYELSYTIKNLNFALGYSHTKNDQNTAVARFKDVFPNIPQADNVTVLIPVNLTSSDYFGLTVAAPVRINKWWNMISNANFYYQHFNGVLGTTKLNSGKPELNVKINNSFTLKKGWSAELNGNFFSGGQNGFMVIDPQWGIAAGAQKNVMKNKATLRFNITDIFWTNLPKAVITYNNYIEKWHAYRESRVATLTFTYKFGRNTVQAARPRTTASEEERKRAQ